MILWSVLGVLILYTPRIPFFFLLPGLADTPATLGDLTTFDFYEWDSHMMVQVPSSTSASCSRSHVSLYAFVAEVSVSATSNGVDQYPDVDVVVAIPKHAPSEPDITWTEGPDSSASVLDEDSVETVDMAAYNADIDNAKGEYIKTQKFSCDSYIIVEIVAQLLQITEVP